MFIGFVYFLGKFENPLVVFLLCSFDFSSTVLLWMCFTILLSLQFLGKIRNSFGIHLNARSISASVRSSAAKQLDNVLLLSAKEDDHGGVIVEMSTEPMDRILFTCLLKESIIQWKQQVIQNFHFLSAIFMLQSCYGNNIYMDSSLIQKVNSCVG